MTYVVNESCMKCKLMDCVEVCPVDCFYEGENMLVIHPDECIDCGVCEPECPVEAIIPDSETVAKPLLRHRLAVRDDRLDRAFGLADPAIDAFVGVDDQHVLAFIEAVDGTNLDAIHVLAADAGLGDDISHDVRLL